MPKKVESEQARAQGEKAIRAATENVNAKSLVKLEKLLREVAKKKPAPLSVMPDAEEGTASWDRALVDVAIVELALSLGLPLRTPAGDPRTYTFWLYSWAKRDLDLDAIERVAAHPFFGEALVSSFLPRRDVKDNVGNFLQKALRSKGCDRVFAALDAFGKTIADTWTLGALEVHESWIEGLCQPAVLARCPALARAVRELDVARLFRNQMRAGILDEWGWEARDAVFDRIPKDRDWSVRHSSAGPLGYGVLVDDVGGRAVVVDAERVVLDHKLAPRKTRRDIRAAYYTGGDVLVCEYPNKLQWLIGGGKLQADAYGFFNLPYEGALITKSDVAFHAGDRACARRADGRGAGRRAWFDGRSYYDLAQEVVIDGRDTSKEGMDAFYMFDPATGKRTGRALPAWMASRAGEDGKVIAHISVSFMAAVPKGSELSPLGAKDGLGGFVLFSKHGELFAEGIDGRKARGSVNGLYVAALITFPGRKGFYPVVESAFDLGIALPDGTTPLVPTEHHGYWAGGSTLSLLDWHMLRPRDLKASAALAKCTDDAAKEICDAARDSKDVARAIAKALPEVKHPRLALGIAGHAEIAANLHAIVVRLQSRLVNAAKHEGESPVQNEHVAALAQVFAHERHWWIEKLGVQFGQQVLDVSHFLFDERGPPMVTPASTVLPWEQLLVRVGEILYRVLAPGTPQSKRIELVKVLEVWSASAFPDNMKRVRLLTVSFPKNAEAIVGVDRAHPDRLIAQENRYFLRANGEDKGVMTLRGIESTEDGTFRVPRGAKLVSNTPALARFDRAAIQKTLALLAERGPVPFDASVAQRIAKKLHVGAAAAALVWTAGYDPWLTGDKKLAHFGIDRPALAVAEKELHKKPLRELYARAMPDDPSDMYEGDARIDRLASAWRT